MIKACQILKIRHLPCFAHTLNLVVQDSLKLKEVDCVLKKFKSLVTYFQSSNIATHKLITEQENQNKKPLRVIQEVPTRWNSIYHIIKRILELKNDITIVLLRMPNAPAVLNLEDTLVLQDLIEILSCFDDATKKINLQPSTSEGKCILQNTVESVKTRIFYYEERTLPRLATILDPRLKKEAFRSSDKAKCAVSLLQSEMSLQESLLLQNPEDSHDTTESTINSSKSLFDFLETRIAEKSKNRTVTANLIIYLKEYMERPNANSDMVPLIFWNVSTYLKIKI